MTYEQMNKAEAHYLNHEPPGMFLEAMIEEFATSKLHIPEKQLDRYIENVIESGHTEVEQLLFWEFYWEKVMTEADRNQIEEN